MDTLPLSEKETMPRECETCGETFGTLSKLRLHECPGPSNDEFTVLNDWSNADEMSHQEIAQTLLPQLKEAMPEEQYEVDFQFDLQTAVIETITRDLSANLTGEDWHGMGFKEPEDFLDAEAVSDAIAEQAKWYFEHDQIGKSWDVLQVILEYAEEYDVDSVEVA